MSVTPKELYEKAGSLARELEGKELKNRDRLRIPLQEMPSQDPHERIRNMELCDRSAAELSRMLGKGEVSSKEIVESVFKKRLSCTEQLLP